MGAPRTSVAKWVALCLFVVVAVPFLLRPRRGAIALFSSVRRRGSAYRGAGEWASEVEAAVRVDVDGGSDPATLPVVWPRGATTHLHAALRAVDTVVREHPGRGHGADSSLALSSVAIVAVALTDAAAAAACAHLHGALEAMVRVQHPTHRDRVLRGVVLVVGTADASATCLRLVGPSVSDVLAFAVAPTPTYAHAVAAGVAALERLPATSHVLVFNVTHDSERLHALFGHRTLLELVANERTCVAMSCLEYDAATGVVVAAGLEPVVAVRGEAEHYAVAELGGWPVDASNATLDDVPRPAFFASPQCMLVSRPLLAAAVDHQSSPADAASGTVSVASALEHLDSTLVALDNAVLQTSSDHIHHAGDVSHRADFIALLGVVREWSAIAIDALRVARRGVFHRFEPFHPRRPLPPAAAGTAFAQLANATASVVTAVLQVWRAERLLDTQRSSSVGDAEAVVELALRLRRRGDTCSSPALSVPRTGNTSQPRSSVIQSGFVAMRLRSALAATPRSQRPLVVWYHVCCHCCGFSNEIVGLAVPLQRHYNLMLIAEAGCFCDGFGPYTTAVLNATSQTTKAYERYKQRERPAIWISHTTPLWYEHPVFDCNPPAYVVGRSMFELGVVPGMWLARAGAADEIWVPSSFVRDAFLASGFASERLFIVPEAIDTALYSPARSEVYALPHCRFAREMADASNVASTRPLPAPAGFVPVSGGVRKTAKDVLRGDPHMAQRCAEARHFKFLAVFKWELRKGWDVLLRAFTKAFTTTDKVSLYIVTSIFAPSGDYEHDRDARAVLRWITNFTRALGIEDDALPHIVVVTAPLLESEVAALYRSCDAFVLPTRGEGWGLPTMQAMASGLPTISTDYSGQRDFLLPNVSYPVRVRTFSKVPPDTGILNVDERMMWAEPDEQHLDELMRHVVANRDEAAAVGAKARAHIAARYNEEAVYREHVAPQLARITEVLRHRPPRERSGRRSDC